MAGKRVVKKEEFWNSERAKTIVREHIVPEWAKAINEDVAWNPGSDEEIWQPLSREVESRLYPSSKFVVLVSEKQDAKEFAKNLGEVRLRLLVFIKLLRTWREEVADQYGNSFWDHVVPALEDPKEQIAVETIRQLSSRTVNDAIEDLQALGRTGFRYRLASGQQKIQKVRDCGVELLVEAAKRVTVRLKNDAKERTKANKPKPTGASLGDSSKWPHVILHLEERVLKITYKVAVPPSIKKETRTCFFPGSKQTAFILALLSVYPGRKGLDDLFKLTHKGDQFEKSPGRPNIRSLEKLTRLRLDIENKFKQEFGDHPSGMWILESNGSGYGLNPRGTHWRESRGKDRD